MSSGTEKSRINEKNGFIVFLLIVSLIVNAVLLLGRNQTGTARDIQPTPPTVDMSQLRTIALKCGVDESKVDSSNANELLAEIKIKFNEADGYYGELLNENDMKRFDRLLSGEDKYIKILREQFVFMQKIKGKDIIILK